MDTREALNERIRLAREEHQILGLFYECTLEGMADMFGAPAAYGARGAVARSAGWMSFFRYPVSDLLRLVDGGAELVMREQEISYTEVLEQLGTATAGRFLESPLGRAFRLITGRDPHAGLSSSMSSARNSSTYGQRGYQRLSHNQALLSFQGEMMGPAWVNGLYSESLRLITGVEMQMVLKECDAAGTTFRLLCSW
jgi:uncharacterized protein (TIGR02265 family)